MQRITGAVLVLLFSGVAQAQPDPWAAPPSYYAGVSGTGQALRSTLTSAMSSGHIQRQYGEFRYSAALHDADPNIPGNILLVYNNASVSAAWDSGNTWNREHVWPQSLQPGSVSNTTRGNLGDPHALRPSNPSINSSRGNKPFGMASTTGVHRSLGTFYFPGDVDKGDIARSLFYSETRWGPSIGITLVNGVPSGNQMGSLADLVAWHYLDIPDEFERRRNHVIYSQQHNPVYYTNNRNAYVDLPGAVWSVFVDQFNDSQIFIGNAPESDGSSTITLDLGAALLGTPVQSSPILVHRLGFDGTYYAVRTTGDATTNAPLTNGFTGAFPIGASPSEVILVGIDADALATPGSKQGQVVIENLDMTTQGGPGRGGNDADDIVHISVDVLIPGSASFSETQVVQSISVDLGVLAPTAMYELPVDLTNLASTGTPTAALLIDIESGTGDTEKIALQLAPLLLAPGQTQPLVANLTGEGSAQATYTLSVSDDPSVLGATQRSPLTLSISTTLSDVVCPGDLADSNGVLGNPDGVVDFGDLLALFSLAGPCPGNVPGCEGDLADSNGVLGNSDGVVDFGDLLALFGLAGSCK
jgi:endonuclease I